MEPNKDGSEVQETTEKVAEETTQETPETLTPEQIADLKKKADASSQNYERLKKAEAEVKEMKEKLKGVVPSNEPTLSPKDLLALNEASVSSEDFDEVVRVAKLLDKPIHQALKDTTLKTILETRVSERKTAAATQTRSARGATKVTGEDLLLKAERTGEVPDTDEGMQELFKARLARKFPKKN